MAKWEEITSQLSVCKEPVAIPPSSCYESTDLITIRVKDTSTGAKEKDYIFFRQLLAWHSSYFAAATDPVGGFATNEAKLIELEVSHKVFDAFHYWVYTGRLKDTPEAGVPLQERYLDELTLYEIWIFADFRGIPSLGNSAIDMVYERWVSSWVAPKAIDLVYENTSSSSNLRALIVDWYTNSATLETLKTYTNAKPTVEFLHDVYPKLAARKDLPLSRPLM